MNKGSKKAEILNLYSEGLKQTEIAEKLGVTQAAISLCLKRAQIKTRMKHPYHIKERIIELEKKQINGDISEASYFVAQGMINALKWVLND